MFDSGQDPRKSDVIQLVIVRLFRCAVIRLLRFRGILHVVPSCKQFIDPYERPRKWSSTYINAQWFLCAHDADLSGTNDKLGEHAYGKVRVLL